MRPSLGGPFSGTASSTHSLGVRRLVFTLRPHLYQLALLCSHDRTVIRSHRQGKGASLPWLSFQWHGLLHSLTGGEAACVRLEAPFISVSGGLSSGSPQGQSVSVACGPCLRGLSMLHWVGTFAMIPCVLLSFVLAFTPSRRTRWQSQAPGKSCGDTGAGE